MKENFRLRFWVDIGLGSITGFILLMTALFPDWLELMTSWDPDRHDGSEEWVIVACLSLATLLLFALAAVEWRWRWSSHHRNALRWRKGGHCTS